MCPISSNQLPRTTIIPVGDDDDDDWCFTATFVHMVG